MTIEHKSVRGGKSIKKFSGVILKLDCIKKMQSLRSRFCDNSICSKMRDEGEGSKKYEKLRNVILKLDLNLKMQWKSLNVINLLHWIVVSTQNNNYNHCLSFCNF